MSAVAPWLRVAVAMTAVGWGANHFAGLLPVYRESHSEAFVSVAVGIYAAGLIPALLCVAAVGDRLDHRSPVRAAVVLSAVATVLLVTGAEYDAMLNAGRFVAGAATGIVLAPGTAWLMDLSRATPGAGPRRATVSLSLGFGGGPLVVGLIGQWAPHPAITPYAAHLLLSVAALVVVWTVPVAAPSTSVPGSERSWRRVGRALAERDFVAAVPITAPWVFGAASTAFAVVPGALPMDTLPVASAAVVLGVTLFGGIAVQPVAKRLEARRSGRSLVVGMATASVGLLVIAAAFLADAAALQFVVAVVLGAAYGLLLAGGLSGVERVSHADDRTRINAVFYTLAYLGFAAPYGFVLLTEHVTDRTTVMVVGAAVAAGTALAVALMSARPRGPRGALTHAERRA